MLVIDYETERIEKVFQDLQVLIKRGYWVIEKKNANRGKKDR